MTIEQAFKRLLKEWGVFWPSLKLAKSCKTFKEFSNLLYGLNKMNNFRFWFNTPTIFIHNIYSINSGDIVSVATNDGKYTCDYKVLYTRFFDLSASTYNGTHININRITAINGKPVDFKNGWYLIEDIQQLFYKF